jgi:hypothetical protein
VQTHDNHKVELDAIDKKFCDKERRERIALAAMQGIISTLTIFREESIEFVTKTAVGYADALIRELDSSVI